MSPPSLKFDLLQCFKEVWRHVGKRRRHQLSWLLGLMVVVSMFDALAIGAVVPFLGVLVSPEKVFAHPIVTSAGQLLHIENSQQLVQVLVLGFASIVVLAAVLRILLLVLQTHISQNIGLDLGVSIYQRTLHQPYAVHMSRNSSDIIAGIWKSDTVVGSFVFPILTIVSTLIMLLLTIPALLFIAGRVLLLLCLILSAIYIALTVASRKKVLEHSHAISRSQNRVLQIMQEGLGGIRDVLIDGSQAVFVKAYQSADHERRNAISTIQILSSAPKFLLESVAILVLVSLAFFLSEHGGVSQSIPMLGAIAMGIQRILPSAQQAYAGWTTVRGGYSSLRDVLDLLNQPLPSPPARPTESKIDFHETFELRGVSFQYAKSLPRILDEIDLTIRKGERIGIVGATGCGKTTLADLIMGLLPPSEGEIVIDGKTLSPQTLSAWMGKIAHVPQMVFLADASIAENIAFGTPENEVDTSRVREAAEKAQLSKDIEAWERRYATKVGERGVRLSGGQRQRIGIARALYKNAEVLILDEATSALDGDTESLLTQTLDSLGGDLTIISIAHRLTTLKNCHSIVELDGGKIVRQMTFEQMMNRIE